MDAGSSANNLECEPPGLDEPHLAEHYFEHVVDRFAQTGMCYEQLRMWRVTIPALAYSSQNVRRGILTLAAICLYHDKRKSPRLAAECLEVAERHGKAFVQGSLEQIFELGLSNKDAILACSRLLCVLGFAFYGVHRRNGVKLVHSAAWTWIHLLRGVKPVHDVIYKSGYKVGEVFLEDLVYGTPPSPQPSQSEAGRPATLAAPQSTLLEFLRRCHRERFKLLRATARKQHLLQADRQSDPTLRAIDVLQEVTAHICSTSKPDRFRLVCVWPSQLPQPFFEALMACEPLPLAIYAQWLMLVMLVEDLWWVNDMGRAVIEDIIDMCATADADVQVLLNWPRSMVQL